MAVDNVPSYSSAEPASTAVGAAVRQVGAIFTTEAAGAASGLVVRQAGISITAAADGQANVSGIQQLTHGLVWNGTTWDRARGNIDGTAISQAVRTAVTVESSDIINYEHRGAHVVMHYSLGTANLVLRIQGKNEASGTYYNLLTTASISVTSSPAFIIYPSISAGGATAPAGGGQRSDVLPRTWRVTVVGSGTSATANYGVGFSMIK